MGVECEEFEDEGKDPGSTGREGVTSEGTKRTRGRRRGTSYLRKRHEPKHTVSLCLVGTTRRNGRSIEI